MSEPADTSYDSPARRQLRAFTSLVGSKNEVSGNVFYRWHEARKIVEQELIDLAHLKYSLWTSSEREALLQTERDEAQARLARSGDGWSDRAKAAERHLATAERAAVQWMERAERMEAALKALLHAPPTGPAHLEAANSAQDLLAEAFDDWGHGEPSHFASGGCNVPYCGLDHNVLPGLGPKTLQTGSDTSGRFKAEHPYTRSGRTGVDPRQADERAADLLDGLPPDLARVLRDPSIIVPQDQAVFEQIARWKNASSDTASALPPSFCPGCGNQTLDSDGTCRREKCGYGTKEYAGGEESEDGWSEEPEDERWTFRACPDCGGAKMDEGPGEPHPSWPKCSC